MDQLNLLFAAQRAIHDHMRLPLSIAAQVNPIAHLLSEFGEAFFHKPGKPKWGIDNVRTPGGLMLDVMPKVIYETPFCDLLHFRQGNEIVTRDIPRMLVIAPMSGHFATLLRRHVRILLPHFDVAITDWKDPRMVSVEKGDFSLDDYVDLIGDCFDKFGRGGPFHCIAVCQPGPLALVATAISESSGIPCPETLTIIASPIDTRKSPTRVNRLAEEQPLSYFENQITNVDQQYPGAGRKIYPEYLQLLGFMTPNMHKHIEAHSKAFVDRLCGNSAAIKNHREFYDEYNAVMPLPQPYQMETLARIFKDQPLVKDMWLHRGKSVSLKDIRRTKILTIEGERDDICGRGQTEAAHDLCTSLPATHKRRVVIKDAGHYGAFQGRAFAEQGLPAIIEIAK